ncbi:protein-L-isoaspartate(D-aspartate) O-methyltransferase [Spirochaeta thermophila]|nr:protein-L-isoaspartate(D-aspartate) O-methyltransferase [Spirochaeta thermophila]
MEKDTLIRLLEREGIHERRILDAIDKVPREEFVPPDQRQYAYENIPLEIGWGQTISQPYTVAFMIQLLELMPGHKVLEVGGGSGYNAAVMWEVMNHTGELYSMEIHPEVYRMGKANLERTGYTDIRFILGDGSKGLPEEAPFDRIIVTAAAEETPSTLLSQLGEEGILVIPVHVGGGTSVMTRIQRGGDEFHTTTHGYFRFVPLVTR